MPGQRFAFDFVRVDDRKGFHLHPAGTVRTYVIGGERESAKDGGSPSTPRSLARSSRPWMECRNDPRRARLALVLKNAATFDPAKRGLDPVAGNHVIIRTGGTSALSRTSRREWSP